MLIGSKTRLLFYQLQKQFVLATVRTEGYKNCGGYSATKNSIVGGIYQPFSSKRNYSIATSVVLGLMMDGEKHSKKKILENSTWKILVLPATADNFMYLIVDKNSMTAFAVDPVEPEYVVKEAKEQKATLVGILTTHHHLDHSGGNKKLVELVESEGGKLVVYGGDDRIEGLTKKIGQDDKIALGSLEFDCLFTPCHTSGHVCYFLKTDNNVIQKPAVFTGDTLFIAGCGRFFEGTAAQMHDALIEKLGNLPPDTFVFCGHEYTVQNLKFALSVEPDNEYMQDKISWAKDQRAESTPTVPSTIGEEKRINPFMRCINPEIQKKMNTPDAISLMAKLREMKDNYKS